MKIIKYPYLINVIEEKEQDSNKKTLKKMQFSLIFNATFMHLSRGIISGRVNLFGNLFNKSINKLVKK